MYATFPDLGLSRFNAHWPKISSMDFLAVRKCIHCYHYIFYNPH